MINLNDPKLTKQEKSFMLALQTDKELKAQVDKEKARGNNYCFNSYWVVQTKDIIAFNKGAHQIDTCFDFEKEGIEQIFPEFHNILFEGERVEIGEWDKTYKRWSSHSYQRVGVVFINGSFGGFKDGHILMGSYEPEKEHKDHLEFLYPESFGKNISRTTFGLIDIPLHLLEDFEEKRVYERSFWLSNAYDKTKAKYLKDRQDFFIRSKKNKAKVNAFRNSKRKKSDFKSFGGGFGK